jgi:galactitol-specific phosphotransferase system IIB component
MEKGLSCGGVSGLASSITIRMEVETIIEKIARKNEPFRKTKKSVGNIAGFTKTYDKSGCV